MGVLLRPQRIPRGRGSWAGSEWFVTCHPNGTNTTLHFLGQRTDTWSMLASTGDFHISLSLSLNLLWQSTQKKRFFGCAILRTVHSIMIPYRKGLLLELHKHNADRRHHRQKWPGSLIDHILQVSQFISPNGARWSRRSPRFDLCPGPALSPSAIGVWLWSCRVARAVLCKTILRKKTLPSVWILSWLSLPVAFLLSANTCAVRSGKGL